MLLISHRANISGPNPETENHPDYIKKALKLGYDVEIDVWHVENKFVLGHDSPQYEVSDKFLKNYKLWCHAKNHLSLAALMDLEINNQSIHYFTHNTDDYTITSKKWAWAYPGKPILNNRTIAVMPERIVIPYDISKAGGICSDYIDRYATKID